MMLMTNHLKRSSTSIRWPALLILFVIFGAPMVVPTAHAPVSTPLRSESHQTVAPQVHETYGKLPLRFEANQGQTDGRVQFLARGSGYTLFLTSTEAILALKGGRGPGAGGRGPDIVDSKLETVFRMELVSANPSAQVAGLDELPGKSNYFIGNNPQNWHTDVPNYARVEYQDVYPGVNLVYYGNQRQLEYDFIVAPGADPQAIVLGFEGADELSIDNEGDLVLRSAGGALRQHKPLVYQEINGERQTINGRYRLRGKRQAGFELAAYDAGKPLIIDPLLRYATYFGGTGDDQGFGIAVDGAGNAYVTGFTSSTNFPTASPLRAANAGGVDVFVTKLNAAGNALVYSTYLGGSGFDQGTSIAVDAAGNAYVTGTTTSTNFPTASPLQAANGGGVDAFVTKLNAAGNGLVYSTYLGGSKDDSGLGIAVDSSGNAYLTGQTFSANFPTRLPLQAAIAGRTDAFVAKLNTAGSALVYSTYLGGSQGDAAFGIAVDAAGNAYVTGETDSKDFPTANALQRASAGSRDAFLTKLNAAGSAFVYSTYLGGIGADSGLSVAVDAAGNAYIAGRTSSSDFPTGNGYGGNIDAFVAKFNPAGDRLIYATYLGGNAMDAAYGIAADAAGNAYVTGTTTSGNFPTTSAVQITNRGSGDAFVTKLTPFGDILDYSTYLGGSGSESARAIAIDAAGNAYITGATNSIDFPMAGALQGRNRGGPYDAFIVKIAQIVPASVTLNPTSILGGNPLMGTVTLDNPAPLGDAVVNLSSNNPSVAAVDDRITVRAGATTATFPVITNPVAASTTVTISASRGGVTKTATLSVQTVVPTSVSFDSTTVTGGMPSTGTVTLNGPALPVDLVVNLSSNNPAVARVPATIMVPAGQNAVDFTVDTTPVAAMASVMISASRSGVTRMATLNVVPPALDSLTLDPTTVTGSESSFGTVTLTGPAPSGGIVINLSSSHPAVAPVRATITVAAGDSFAAFTVTTNAVAANTNVTISASRNSVTRRATLNVLAPVLDTLTLDPTMVTGGTPSIGTITLTGPAPSSGTIVALSSNNPPVASVPATATVPAGQFTATFTVDTRTVDANTDVVISATSGTTRTATLTVAPSANSKR